MAAWQLDDLKASIRREKFSFSLLGSLLLVALCTILVASYYQHRFHREGLERLAANLMYVLGSLPAEQLLGEPGSPSTLSLLSQSPLESSLAYVEAADMTGRPVLRQAALDVVIPPAEPWLEGRGEPVRDRSVTLTVSAAHVREFSAPVVRDGHEIAFIRVGFFEPQASLLPDSVSLAAAFALPIILLAPWLQALVTARFRPLTEVGRRLGQIARIEGQAFSADSSDPVASICEYTESAVQRMERLAADHSALEAATKLDSYRRARLESVLQSLPFGVLLLDETGAVSFATDRLGLLLGVPVEDVLGKAPIDWSRDEVVVSCLARLKGRAASGHSDRISFTPKAHPEKVMTIASYPMFANRQSARRSGTLVVIADDTENALVRNASADFVSHVAHELESPLNALAMYSESLQGPEGADERFRVEAANALHGEVERLALLVNNVLSISKMEMGSIGIERQRVKLHDLLVDVLESASRAADGRQITFESEIPSEIGPVAVDKELMRVALNNLLGNAVKYSDDGDTVVLSAVETERTVRITVRDTGIGMAPEEQKRIFEKFARGDSNATRARPGHGLGLALAREIVQLHQGTLTVRSALGEGSEFTIELGKEAGLLRNAS